MDQSCVIWENNEEYSLPWADLPADMRGSPLFLCLFSTSCWVNLMPTAGDKIFHFGACRVSMSLAEIRAGFTAIKANIVSIPRGAGGALEPLWSSSVPISLLPQQSRDPIRTLSILSHPHSLHKVKVGGPGWGALGGSKKWVNMTLRSAINHQSVIFSFLTPQSTPKAALQVSASDIQLQNQLVSFCETC